MEFQSIKNEEGLLMSEMNKPNKSIQCGVCSCEYHDQSDYCCLNKIRVEAVPGQSSGKAEDESMCGSYRCRCGH